MDVASGPARTATATPSANFWIVVFIAFDPSVDGDGTNACGRAETQKFTEPDPRTNAAPLGFGNHVLLKTRNMHKRAVDLTLKEQNALDAGDY